MAKIRLSVGFTSSSSISSTNHSISSAQQLRDSMKLADAPCKARKLIVDSPDRLLNCLLEIPTDAHDLADTLHAATE
jgi:hypothetical protein